MVYWDSNPMLYMYKSVLGYKKLGLDPNSYHHGTLELEPNILPLWCVETGTHSLTLKQWHNKPKCAETHPRAIITTV